MKKLTVIFLLFISFILATSFNNVAIAAASQKNVHNIEYVTKDKYVLQSTLKYPKQKKTQYPFVVLIHSWGLASSYWGSLPEDLVKAGYAVLEVDLRGHGKSNMMENLSRRSYIYLSHEATLQIPNDVYQILSQVYSTYTNLSKREVYFIGADIGATASVYVAKYLKMTPAAMVLITPQIKFRGIQMANTFLEIGDVPVLAVASKKDALSIAQINTLEKYAQGSFSFLKLPHGGPGMLCLTVNEGATSTIITWLKQKTPSLNK